MDLVSIIGVLASVFTASSMLPQLIKILKEKKAENVSIPMFIILLIGLAFWVAYGFLKEDYILLFSNAFSLVINVITMILSLKYKTNR